MPTFTFTMTFQADVADPCAASDLGAAAVEHMQDTFNDDGSLDGWTIAACQDEPRAGTVQAPNDSELPAA